MLIFGLAFLYGTALSLILRGSYWLYRRYFGVRVRFSSRWLVALAVIGSLASLVGFYFSIKKTT